MILSELILSVRHFSTKAIEETATPLSLLSWIIRVYED